MKRGLFLLLGLVISATAAGQGEPIRGGAPAWDDNFNPQVTEYDVVKGDTLWDISARVVGDPFLWPKVWSLNPEITNPHWIYPGDRIRFFQPELELPSQAELIAGTMGMPEDETEEPALGAVEEIGSSETPHSHSPEIEIIGERPVRSRSATGLTFRFLERFVTPQELQEAGVLTNAAPDLILLSEGNRVYLRFPSSKRPAPGSKLLAYRTTTQIYHPTQGDHRGYLTQITGLLEVTSPQSEEVTSARIIRSFYEMERGNFVTPVEQDLLVRLVPVPTAKAVEGVVMAVREGNDQVAGDLMLVYIDRGKRDGLERGNRLEVITESDFLTGDAGEGFAQPVGLLQIIDARDSASTCLVVRAAREIEPGLEVRTVIDASAAPAPEEETAEESAG